MTALDAPVILYGVGTACAIYPTAQECRKCHTMHFMMFNTYGQTVCAACDVAPGKEAG